MTEKTLFLSLVGLFSSILYRKIAAGLLLVVLFFIQAEKIFHTHQNHYSTKQQQGSTVSTTSSCTICDFQMAANAELPILDNVDLPFSIFSKPYVDYTSQYNSLPIILMSDRGPPVC